MKTVVLGFLKTYWDGQRPLLLGLSGGPDSLALLYVLKEHRIPLHLAHVDHGWREESAEEACQLEALAKELGFPIHLKRLDGLAEGNREAVCRDARLTFFRHLTAQLGCQAVLLAHHADDLAETALKRVLEGASLPCLGSMRECAEIDGLPIWRPLLKMPKKAILEFVAENGLMPFHDRTNEDTRYLRARMRCEILPGLKEQFGKEIQGALCTVAEEANELRDYLELRTKAWLQRIRKTASEVSVDLTGHNLHEFELRYVVRKFCEESGLGTSRVLVKRIIDLLQQGAVHKKVEQGTCSVLIDRGRLTVNYPIPDTL